MTKETIKKADAGQELKIVDVSQGKKSKGAGKSVAVLLAAALLFGLALAAVAEGAHVATGAVDELPATNDGKDMTPPEKPPVPPNAGLNAGARPTRLPV